MLLVVGIWRCIHVSIIHHVGDLMRGFMRGVRLRPVRQHAEPEHKKNAEQSFHRSNLNNRLHSHPFFGDIFADLSDLKMELRL